jgi:hypothetical protein
MSNAKGIGKTSRINQGVEITEHFSISEAPDSNWTKVQLMGCNGLKSGQGRAICGVGAGNVPEDEFVEITLWSVSNCHGPQVCSGSVRTGHPGDARAPLSR